jgi:hypothetical protein
MDDDRDLLRLLERAAESLGVPVIYEALATEELAGRGGGCVVYGERRIIVERSLGSREKARLLAQALSRLEVETCYLPPAVRAAIEAARRAEPGEERGG